MKITDFAAKPIQLELKHPVSGEGLGVKVTIVGKNSRQFKSKFYDIVEASQREGADKKSSVEKMRVAEKQSAELIAICMLGWSDDEFFGGEFSTEKALEIVGQPELSWVKDQIDAAIVEEGIFFQK